LISQRGHGTLGGGLEIEEALLRVRSLPQALEALGDHRPVGPQPLTLARGLQHVAALSKRRFRAKTRIPSLGQRVAIGFELLERRLTHLESCLGPRDGFLCDLEPAWVLVALRLECPYGVVDPALCARRSFVAAADAGLEAITEGALVPVEVFQLLVADRRRGAEECFVRDAGQVGNDFLRLCRIRVGLTVVLEDDPSALAAELLLQDTPEWPALGIRLVLFVGDELEPRERTIVLGQAPGSERLDLGRRSRRLAEERELETALDSRLARLVGTSDDREARSKLDVQVAWFSR
jgi:hypothetical protein